MPVYPYECDDCFHEFEIAKRVANIEDTEACPSCDSASTHRNISDKTSFYGADQWDTEAYDPALGMVIKNNSHRKQVAKERGLIEVGNESPDKIHKHNETELDRQAENRWAKV